MREAIKRGYRWDHFNNGVRGIFQQLIRMAYYCHRRYADEADALFKYKAMIEAIEVGAKDSGFVFLSPDGKPIRKSNFIRRVFHPLIEKAVSPRYDSKT